MKQLTTLTAALMVALAAVSVPTACSEESQKRREYRKEMKELRSAAVKGDAESQYRLGARYASDRRVRLGFKRDFPEALKWLSRSAEQGHSEAQYTLGLMHLGAPLADTPLEQLERGVPRDVENARYWFQRAASQGDPFAQRHVAQFFQEDGDYESSLMWYLLAERGKDTFAPIGISEVKGHMKDSEIARAENLAANWRPVSEATESSGELSN